jgi:glycosyltransferase involved in cell wall biosynthesis
MNIAHVESSLHWGGQELRTLEQMEWLRRHGHRVWLVARAQAEIMKEAQKRGFPTYSLEIRNSFNPILIYKLIGFLRKNQIDIVDAHSSKEGTQLFFIKMLTGIKVVRSRHISNSVKHDFFHRLIWKYGNDRVITTANTIKQDLIALNLDKDKIDVAIPGVDEKRFYPQLRQTHQFLKKTLGIPEYHQIVANIGMIREDKGQLFFVHACQQIAHRLADVSFIQVGEATASSRSYKEQVLDAARRLGLETKIHFLGYQSAIEHYLSISDIVIIASIGTEGQTRLVSQAFLTKTAVIATAVGGLTEMIIPGQTGLLCPPASAQALAEAAITLLQDTHQREQLCENAFNYASKHLLFDKMMEAMLRSYRQATGP